MFDIFKTKHSNKIRPVVLLILDGWGIAPDSPGNAISQAKTPNMDYLYANYPNASLIASGESVGLPANEVGNTEVGHLTIGTGRVINQDLKRINNAIEDRSFFANHAFLQAIDHAKKNNSSLHLMGIFGSGKVHGSIDHLIGLLDLCKEQKVEKVFVHLFTDGRDSPPKEAIALLPELESKLKELPFARIASVCGRYYAMDRDARWERTKIAYEGLTLARGEAVNSASEGIKQSYDNNMTDEFIKPLIIFDKGKPVATINDNDAVIFYNFRIDRPRQLAQCFVIPDFGSYMPGRSSNPNDQLFKPEFEREVILKNLFFVTMTVYHEALKVSSVAFPTPHIENYLSAVLAKQNLLQMHMAESEKERFVTYYFNGMNESRSVGEFVDIAPSPKVATYDQKPEMSVFDIVRSFKKHLNEDKFHFFVMNFANPDMVAHTGNLKKSIEAISFTDKAIGQVFKLVTDVNGLLIVTADHGNAEELISLPTTSFFYTSDHGSMNTDHSNNPVPVIFVSEGLKNSNLARQNKKLSVHNGYLSDIAPTILAIMNIDKPSDMTGNNLIQI